MSRPKPSLNWCSPLLKLRARDLGNLVFGIERPAHGQKGFIIGLVKVRKGKVEEIIVYKTYLE